MFTQFDRITHNVHYVNFIAWYGGQSLRHKPNDYNGLAWFIFASPYKGPYKGHTKMHDKLYKCKLALAFAKLVYILDWLG